MVVQCSAYILDLYLTLHCTHNPYMTNSLEFAVLTCPYPHCLNARCAVLAEELDQESAVLLS